MELYTAIITPFYEDSKEIDFDSYRNLIERQIEAGVKGIIPCGTTGESPTLSHQEHRRLIAETVKYAKGKIQVIAGTGSNSTTEAIELTDLACKDGVDAIMLVSPYYNKPTQQGLIQHFLKIADSSTVPVMIYNIESRTGVNIELATMIQLAEHEKIQAIKEASGNIIQMIQLKKSCGQKLSLLCGDDNITPAFMGIGGKGIVSVASNLYPKKIQKMIGYYQQGDFKSGNSIFYSIVDLMNALFWCTNPIPVKEAAAIQKLCEKCIRLPLTALEPELSKKLTKLLEILGEDS